MRLKGKCFDQIKRVMRQRALSVDLNPKIEEDCLPDLSLFCFDKIARGEEILCLQDNMDKLADKCKTSIINITEAQAHNIELNPYIMKNCRGIIETVCSAELNNVNGDVMNCLISNKNNPLVKSNSRCKVSIEHFQIISMKDFRFSYKFKSACKPYAIRFCHDEKTKASVVRCLSEKVVKDTMVGVKSDIHKDCRQQLRAQLFMQRENIEYDPKLARACDTDIKRHCSNIPHGSAQVNDLNFDESYNYTE